MTDKEVVQAKIEICNLQLQILAKQYEVNCDALNKDLARLNSQLSKLTQG